MTVSARLVSFPFGDGQQTQNGDYAYKGDKISIAFNDPQGREQLFIKEFPALLLRLSPEQIQSKMADYGWDVTNPQCAEYIQTLNAVIADIRQFH
ncbi:MAG: hypothetical protein CMH30_07130 [Micavibrio sp.]|nr:hypothetical protein [Micavibrio sp.]